MSWLDDLLYGYRTIRNALGADSPTRAALKIVGATVADDPTTGATIITIAGGTPLATLTGAGFVHVNSSDAQNPVVSLSPAPTAAATPETLVARDASGDSFFADVYASNGFIATASGALDVHQATAIAGDGADGLIKAQSGTQSGDHDGGDLHLSGGLGHGTGVNGGVKLEVGGVKVLSAERIALGGGLPAVVIGPDGLPCGLVINGASSQFQCLFAPTSSASGSSMAFQGQNTSFAGGDGGSVTFNTGSGGAGGLPGELRFRIAGTIMLLGSEVAGNPVLAIGEPGDAAASVQIHGPYGTTVGGAGGASPLPATPAQYVRVLFPDGTELLLPGYLPP